jgi:drug/metabolite transporter (DMT)-like permease
VPRWNSQSLRALIAALRSSGAAAGGRNEPVAALVLVSVSMALFVGISAVGRSAALAGLDPLQVLFFRNFFCLFWLLPMLAWRGRDLVRTHQFRLYSIRIALSFIALLTLFQALAYIPIGEVTAIKFLAPLFGALFAILLLGEHVGVRRWTALCVGFFGVLVMLRPSGSAFGFGQVAALISALSLGVIGPLIKKLTAGDDADRIVFITNLVMTPLSLVPALFVWQWPSWDLWPQLMLMGLFAVLGHLTLVRGYAVTDASLAMILSFSRLPFSVLVGYLAFGELIDLWTWAGAIVIFAAAAFVTRDAALRARARVPPAVRQPRPVAQTVEE